MSDVLDQPTRRALPKRGRSEPWSEEEDRIIVAGLAAGRSSSRIARDLSHRSRNAVIGRISRQQAAGKYPKLQTAPAPAPPTKRRRGDEKPSRSRPPLSAPLTQNQRAAAAAVRLEPQPIVRPVCDDAVIPIGQGCGILELTDDRCKWILNNPPRFGTFVFCGGQSIPGFPYCKFHMRKAYKPLAAYGRHPPNRRPIDD